MEYRPPGMSLTGARRCDDLGIAAAAVLLSVMVKDLVLEGE